MDEYHTFYVQKSPQAFDDTLVAFGLATIVQDLLERQDGGYITIIDKGAYYELQLSTPLLRETVIQETSSTQPISAIETEKTELPFGMARENYSHHIEVADTYFKTRGQENETEPPHIYLDIWKAINDFSKFNVLGSYNSLIEYWFFARQHAETLMLLLDMFSNHDNNYETAIMRWQELSKQQGWGLHSKNKYEVTQLQIFNPTSGKGQNKIKADGLGIGNLGSFWLIEWLKAIGIYAVGLTKYLGGTGDQKTLILAPRKLTFDQHRRIMSKFRNRMISSQTAIKLDILAVTHYTSALLEYIIEYDDPLLDLFGLGEIKQTVVSGFYTAHYKNMGNALAAMNLSFIALPGWVEVQTPEDVGIYRAVLEELEQVVRQFDESHSDDVTLLQHLRDFISGDELRPFLRFTTSYASFYMRKRERGYAIALSTDFIERMIQQMGNQFAELADRQRHTGFHNIAAAIAQVTIWAQHNKDGTPYKIRYGLHRELARQAQTPEKFLRVINQFVHSYNTETMRAKELNKSNTGDMISPQDIDDLLEIVDIFDRDSQLVAEILLAYGSTFKKFVRNE